MKKFIYYLLHWTWALPMNIIGGIICLIALCCKCPVQKYRNAIEILVPWNFGGLEMGMFFIRGKDCPSVAPHEYGHSIQMLWWGPLFPFVIALPSALRYWIREFKTPKARRIFLSIVLAAAALIALIVGILAAVFGSLFWAVVAIVFFIYSLLLIGWGCFIELPQYEIKKTKYDDVWFEGQATELGNLANKNKWSWL